MPSEPRVTSYDTEIFPEGTAIYADEQPRAHTPQAHGRHAAQAIIAATSGKQTDNKRK